MISEVIRMLFGRSTPDIGEDIRREAGEAVRATRQLSRVAYDQVDDAYRVAPPYRQDRVGRAVNEVIGNYQRARRS